MKRSIMCKITCATLNVMCTWKCWFFSSTQLCSVRHKKLSLTFTTRKTLCTQFGFRLSIHSISTLHGADNINPSTDNGLMFSDFISTLFPFLLLSPSQRPLTTSTSDPLLLSLTLLLVVGVLNDKLPPTVKLSTPDDGRIFPSEINLGIKYSSIHLSLLFMITIDVPPLRLKV